MKIQTKYLLFLICVSQHIFTMQKERTRPRPPFPLSSNPLDPYDCGYLDKMPAPDADLAKLAIDTAPERIKQLVRLLSNERSYDTIKPKNLLLHGESGSGKSTLAQAIALQSGHPYSFVNTCWLGNSIENSATENLHRIVNYGLKQKQKPYIIILNEMVGFLENGNIEDEAYTLRRLIENYNDEPGIYFIGVVPDSRTIVPFIAKFFGSVTLSLPDREAREKAIKYYMTLSEERATSFACTPKFMGNLAHKTEGFHFFAIQTLVNDATWTARLRAKSKKTTVTEIDMEEVFNHIQEKRKEIGEIPYTLTDRIHQHPYCAVAACAAISTIIATRYLKK
jgi:AAA+ superfamily predicted ATPase